jgi:colanic acid biosynthesis glycosyl transferase WcaI
VRILFLNRSYHPDVEATGQLLTELCTDLAREHEVTVIAGRPNFVMEREKSGLVQEDQHQGVRILRVRNARFRKVSLLGRAFGLVSYLVLAAWAAMTQRRPDVFVVETDPPVLGALGAFLKWWYRRPFVFYLQDLFPEVGLVLGRLRPGLLTRLLHWLTQVGLEQADRVVVLGEDMRQRVLDRGIDPAKVVVIPNWADVRALSDTSSVATLRQQWQVDERCVVMYSGNVGLSQSLDKVLTAAAALRNEPVQFLIVGEGAAKPQLQAQAAEQGLDNVRFLPYQPKALLGSSLAAADVHLVPLQRGLAGFMVPSKLYGILAAGRPYIASVDADGETALVTQRGGCGLRVDPDAPEQLVEAIRWCLQNREEAAAMGRRGRELAWAEFDRAVATGKFADVVQSLAAPARVLRPAVEAQAG